MCPSSSRNCFVSALFAILLLHPSEGSVVAQVPKDTADAKENIVSLAGRRGYGTIGEARVQFQFHDNGKLVISGDLEGSGKWTQAGTAVSMETKWSIFRGDISAFQVSGRRTVKDNSEPASNWNVDLEKSAEEASEKKYALLIGVHQYAKTELRSLAYAENDVTELAAVLKQGGYRRVVLMTQTIGAREARFLPLAENIKAELRGLLGTRRTGDTVLVAFAGHGVQFKNDEEPYFCPMDARLSNKNTLVSLTWVYEQLSKCQADVKLLFVDACRNEPQTDLSRSRPEVDLDSVTRPQEKKPPGGVAAFFSCSKGEKAYESPDLKHGVFFHYLLEGLRGRATDRSGLVTVRSLDQYVSREVADYVQDKFGAEVFQQPVFKGEVQGAVPLLSSVAQYLTNSIGMKLVRIPAGKFTMGSPASEEGRDDHEGPVHDVEITRSFHMGVHEVTVGEFRAFVQASGYQTEADKDGQGAWGYNAATKQFEGRKPQYTWRTPGWTQTDRHAVLNVTWNDAVAFCQWLSNRENRLYELPTEAEWEYACRAGSATRFYSGDAGGALRGVANVADASLKEALDPNKHNDWIFHPWNDSYPFSAPVGQFRANAFGLHDMHGNVLEWCADWYEEEYYSNSPPRDPKGPAAGEYRVVRGGSWDYDADYCRAAGRGFLRPDSRDDNVVGFRVVCRDSP